MMRVLGTIKASVGKRRREHGMGEVYVPIEIENFRDRILAEEGHLSEGEIRSEKVDVLTDTGATLLLLPQDLVDTLGLKRRGKIVVTYADERKEERDTAGVVTVRVGNRSMETRCVVGPPNCEPLLGHVILEELDLLVDPREGKLVPRPESPYFPTLKLK